MDDAISRKGVSAWLENMGYSYPAKVIMDKCEKLQLPPANCSEFPNNSDTISRQAAIDAVNSRKTAEQSSAGIMRNAVVDFCVDIIKKLPSAEPELIKCDYVKACNEVTMNKTFSAWRYLAMLDDFEEYGYVLVKRRG